MFTSVRAGLAAALIALAVIPTLAADKAFKRSDLDDAAIKLEAQIKSDAGTVTKPAADLAARRRRRLPEERFSHRHDWCSASSSRWRPPMRQAGCGCRAPYCRSVRATTTSARCCSIAPRPPPISPTAARATATWKPTAWRCSAGRSPTASCGGQRSIPCGWRSICARAPTCAANTSVCAPSTASGCWITRSIPTPFRRAPASSSRKNCRGGAPISRPLWRWRARTSRRSRPTTSSSAWKASSTASATQITLRAGLPSVVQGDAGEIGRLHHLRARPQAVRAFFRQGLCAAAQRPARHSGAQRQHQRGLAVGLSRRRPQSDRHRARLRFPAQFTAPTRPSGWPTSAAPKCGAAN